MGSKKAEPVKTPFQQQQTQQNTFAPFSVADSQEAKDFLAAPLNFGSGYGDLKTDFNVDPGVGRRTDLAEQGANLRYDSAFNAGIPAWIREINRNKELRDIQGQGAAEAQQAQYLNQQGQRGLEYQKAQLVEGANRDRQLAELERRRQLLPQIVQTGGSGASSGFNTQLTQPQPGLFGSILGAAGQVGSAAINKLPFV